MARKMTAVGARVWKTYGVKWTGIWPLVCHNIQLANPFNSFAKRISELVKLCKKDPSDVNRDELIHTEWLGGLYLDKEMRPVVMRNAIRASIASKSFPTLRGGKDQCKAAINVMDSPLIEHGIPGVRTAKELWEYASENNDALKDKYLLYLPVTVNNNVVMRARPMFPDWSICFEMQVNAGVIDGDTLKKLMETAESGGLYDYRPDYGQFRATYELLDG